MMEQPYSRLILVTKYFLHQFRSGNAHSIHSPQVFDFYNFLQKKPHASLKPVQVYHKDLQKNKEVIYFSDPGKNGVKSTRSISELAKHSAKGQKAGTLLHQIVAFFQPKSMLELGTSLGVSAYYQCLASPNSNFTTVEGVPQIAALSNKNFQNLKLDIEVIVGLFDPILNQFIAEKRRFDYVYVDGHHQKVATLQYFEQIKELLTTEACVIFDDIHWSSGMEEAWSEIVKDPDVAISIDLFFFGVILLRGGVEKQHFSLRI